MSPPDIFQVLTALFSGGAFLLQMKIEHRLTAIETTLKNKGMLK